MNIKKEIRKFIKEKRALLTKDEKEILDNIIFKKIVNSQEYRKAKFIFIFVSYKDEIDTHRVIKKALIDGKVICVPKTISLEEGMYAAQITKFEDLEVGNYGILEPKSENKRIEENLIDLCYVPGLAFDRVGGRMGYGGGFYDRFLIKIRNNCKKIGLTYSFQVLERVPMGENDIFIDGIITD